jgi:hypothetical protein
MDMIADAVWPALQEARSTRAEKRKQEFDAKKTTSTDLFPIGSLVFARNVSRRSKMEAPYEGPYRVHNIIDKNKFVLQDSTLSILARNVPAEQLKLCAVDVPFGDSVQVEAIINHRVTNNKKEYLVRWARLDADHDEWVKEKDFDDLGIIADYWKRTGTFRTSNSTTTTTTVQPQVSTEPQIMKQRDSTATTSASTTEFNSLLEPSESFASCCPKIDKRLLRRHIAIKWSDGNWERARVCKWHPHRRSNGSNCVIKLLNGERYDRNLHHDQFCSPTTSAIPGAWALIDVA